jgi:hypothetical protein
MTAEEIRSIQSHVELINFDAQAWLDQHDGMSHDPWEVMLALYADHAIVEQANQRQTALKSWADRYNLDAGQNYTSFLFGLCHTTLKEVETGMETLAAADLSLIAEVQDLRARIEHLERVCKPVEPTPVNFASEFAHTEEVSSD